MFNSNKIIIVLAIVIIVILITHSNVSKKEPYYEQANNMILPPFTPAYIEMELYGKGGDTNNITLTFRNGNISKTSDLIWNVNDTYTISPNSYIYIGGEKSPSIPSASASASKVNSSIPHIHYELRDINGQVIPSTYDIYNWVKIFVKDGQYVIQPTISGEELYYKTGQVGSWSYKIFARPTLRNISQQYIQPSPN
jgi:hypothetical protein